MALVPADLGTVGSPWLRPSAAGLYALTADPPERDLVLRDPGLVLHVLRYSRPTPDPDTFTFSDAVLTQPGICETAAASLEAPGGSGDDWQYANPHLAEGLRIAHCASKIAAEQSLCTPDAAWAAGLLSQLGWYAAAAHGVTLADAEKLGRRAAVRWRLPIPFATTVGFQNFHVDDAVKLGAHRGMFLAVREAREAAAASHAAPQRAPLQPVAIPTPVLVRLLRTTATARHRAASVHVHELERQVDRLAETLTDLRANFDTAVRDAKLAALAEFAAGASHEINNPLAVIAGNAQLLQPGEDDPDRLRRFAAIVRGTRRIHDILLGTRQFARPHAARPAEIELNGWLANAVEIHRPEAAEKGVALEYAAADESFLVTADPVHVRDALAHLMRNAIEVSPAGGTVTVRVESRGGQAAIVVEDAGPGPNPADVDHLFDPFFSGRAAGRGRGLGLSIAWRLATLNGGTVAYEPTPGGPTRFSLTLPLASGAVRKSA